METQTKKFKNFVVYLVNKTNKKISKPLFFENLNIAFFVRKESSKNFVFIYNKSKEIWNIPQLCNNSNTEEIQEIKSFLEKIKKISILKYIEYPAKQVCLLENQYQKIVKSKEIRKNQLIREIDKKRTSDLPKYPNGYSTDWFFQKKQIEKIEDLRIKKQIKNLSNKFKNN